MKRKNIKFIALALIAAIGLLGAGYAAWNDRDTAVTTVSTGDLSVQMVNWPGSMSWTQYFSSASAVSAASPAHCPDNSVGAYLTRPTITSNITGGENGTGSNVTFSIGNMYPGSGMWSSINLKNNGSIGAKFAALDRAYSTGYSTVLAGAIKVYYNIYKYNSSGVHFLTRSSTGSITLDTLPASLTSDLQATGVLEPNEKVRIDMEFVIPPASLNGHTGENSSFTYTLGYNFVQFNDNSASPVLPAVSGAASMDVK